MRTVVVTGAIGSGKSLLCSFLEEAGMPVYDSDARTKSLYDRDAQLCKAVLELVPEACGTEGRVDRKALASVIFADKSRLQALECLVHPAVYRDYWNWCASFGTPFAVFESAIVLDSGMPEGFADEVVYVDSPRGERIARAAARDNTDESSVARRDALQKAGADSPLVTYVLRNYGTPAMLREEADKLLNYLKEKYL